MVARRKVNRRWLAAFMPLAAIILVPVVASAKQDGLKVFRDERSGIEFRYPGYLINEECSGETDTGERSYYVGCLARHTKHYHCDWSVKVSAMPIDEVAKKDGWLHVTAEDIGTYNLHGFHPSDWLVPTRGMSEPAKAVEYHEWAGLIGSYSWAMINAEGVSCSTCGDGLTALVSDGLKTVIIDYAGVNAGCGDPDKVIDTILQTLSRVTNDTGFGTIGE